MPVNRIQCRLISENLLWRRGCLRNGYYPRYDIRLSNCFVSLEGRFPTNFMPLEDCKTGFLLR
jgi:hypothetical protein